MTRIFLSLLFSITLLTAALAGSPVGNQFTYQGNLQDAGQPVNGFYDFTFTLFDAFEDGVEVAPPIELQDIRVENGIFSVQLDFGASVFTGDARFLSIAVRDGDSVGDFDVLTARQALTAAPYALYALNANISSIDASAVVSGTLDVERMPLEGHWSLSDPLEINRSGDFVRFGSSTGDTDHLIDAGQLAETRFRVDSSGAVVFGGEYDGGTSASEPPVSGAGTRMMWFPERGAFRAGHVDDDQWDDGNIGYFSMAFGENASASGAHAFAAGRNAIASGLNGVAFGEEAIADGTGSVALGTRANANRRQGSFVFGDRSTVNNIRAGVDNAAFWRTAGGFRVYTSSNLSSGVTIHSGDWHSNWGHPNAVISTSTDAYLSTSGVWQNNSDVNQKHAFATVDGEDILARLRALPITSWSYLVEPTDVRHIGPTAQDFHAAFGLGRDKKSIGSVDADGVALAAAKALEQRTSDQLELIEALQAENTELRQRLERLESLFNER